MKEFFFVYFIWSTLFYKNVMYVYFFKSHKETEELVKSSRSAVQSAIKTVRGDWRSRK